MVPMAGAPSAPGPLRPRATLPTGAVSRRTSSAPRGERGRRLLAVATTPTPATQRPSPRPTPPTTGDAAPTATAGGRRTIATTAADTSARRRRPRPRRPRRPAPLPADPFTLGVSVGDPDATSVVLWTRLIGATRCPHAVDVAWEVARDEALRRRRRRRRDRDGARRATVTPSTSSPTLDGPGWYRFHAGGFTSRAGRAAPGAGGDRASCGSRRRRASTSRPASTPPTATSPSGPRTSSCSSATSSTRARRQPGRRRGRAQPRGAGGDRPRRLPRPLRPVPRRPDLQAARAACPWLVVWDDHEVENNYAGLVPQRPGRGGRVPGPPRRRLPGVVGAHAGAAAGADRRGAVPDRPDRAWGGLADLVLLDGRQFRSDQACGVADAEPRPAVPRSGRSGAHDARRRRRRHGWARRWRRRRRRGRRSASRPCDGPPLQRRHPQLRPVGRLRAGPRPPARPGRRCATG